ncbi:MAG: sigma-70 family RNA polymerase sigma factor [Planctomycetota bacterium]|nr:MAG: sigma-70 family RNA polymerase sigma factor [Planctomycetota bacterium]
MAKSRAQIYDELLVLKCQQGDREAFAELVERWQKRLWQYAFQVSGSQTAAWDILQETWYGVVKGINKLKDTAVFPRWVFRILNHKCVDWQRRQHLQSQLSDKLVNQTQDESDEKLNCAERAENLRQAVEKLSPESRAILTLRYQAGFNMAQIAGILDIAEGTVKSRLHRTLKKLREMMGADSDV